MEKIGRYEQFNEMLFEAYCKTSIDRAIAKARGRKKAQGEWEQPLSELTDPAMYEITRNSSIEIFEADVTFYVQGRRVAVSIPEVGQALLRLLPKEREIILLYYFQEMTDDKIAAMLKMSRAAVQRRRSHARQQLKLILEKMR